LGNSPRIGHQSFLLVSDNDFAGAAGAKKVIVEKTMKRRRNSITVLQSGLK
jgi:hypothetical protein